MEDLMSQQRRILFGILVLVLMVAAVLGVDALRRTTTEKDLAPGSIAIYRDGKLEAGFVAEDLASLEQVSFADAEEGKTQEGWMLADVLLLYIKESRLTPETPIAVISTSRQRSAELTWAEVADPANWVMFDVSGRGPLKLVSVLERLDVRDEWVQDVDRIEIGDSQ
jgi:hypothetical protein